MHVLRVWRPASLSGKNQEVGAGGGIHLLPFPASCPHSLAPGSSVIFQADEPITPNPASFITSPPIPSPLPLLKTLVMNLSVGRSAD